MVSFRVVKSQNIFLWKQCLNVSKVCQMTIFRNISATCKILIFKCEYNFVRLF